MFDRSFFKLRNIEGCMTTSRRRVAKTSLKCSQVVCSGVDLFSFDHLDESDPEVFGATNPLNRSIVAGLSVIF